MPNGLQVISFSVTHEKIKATDKRSGDKVASYSQEIMQSKQSVKLIKVFIKYLLKTISPSSTLFLVSCRAREEYWQSIHSFIIFANIYSYDQHREQEKDQCLVWVKCDRGFI